MVYPKYLIRMHKMVKLTMQRRKFILTFFYPLCEIFLYDDVSNEWSNQVDEDPFDSISSCDKSSFQYPHEVNQDPELHNACSNPFFQLKEVEQLDIDMYTPLNMSTFSRNLTIE